MIDDPYHVQPADIKFRGNNFVFNVDVRKQQNFNTLKNYPTNS